MQISASDLILGFKRWREDTSTSPSGRHLGHYRVIAKHVPAVDPTDSFAYQFFATQANLINQCINHSIILPRWQRVINKMIEKDPGDPKIHRLRVIHLFEADLNLIFGIHWNRRLMWRCTQKKTLCEDQWGSRPGKSALDVACLKALTYELSALTRTDCGTFDNDATACYDRIVPNVAMMVAKHYGMPSKGTRFMTTFLHEAEYGTQVTSTPSQYYSTTPEAPLYGTGQGSRASPTIWALVSSFIISSNKMLYILSRD